MVSSSIYSPVAFTVWAAPITGTVPSGISVLVRLWKDGIVHDELVMMRVSVCVISVGAP
jgi:hypothetical protein